MNTSDKRTFYGIWSVAWVILSIPFSALVELSSRDATSWAYLECWFAMLPVAWTIAQIWAGNREQLRPVPSPKAAEPLIMGFNLIVVGAGQMQYGTRLTGLRWICTGLLVSQGLLSCKDDIVTSIQDEIKRVLRPAS